MSAQSAHAFLAAHAPELSVVDQGVSTATVAEAAVALGVTPAEIAKTLSLRVGNTVMLLVTRGDARLDNAKARAALGGKPRMLDATDVEHITGHPVGGVCPFGLATPLPVYCDISLKDFTAVWPAAGSRTTSVQVTPDRLAEITSAAWVDACRLPEG